MAGVETMMTSGSPVGGAFVGRSNQSSRPSSRVGFIVEERSHSRQGSHGSTSSDGLHPRPPSNPRTGSPSLERPSSVRSLRSKTDMSEYLSPVVKTAVRRWKRFHEQRVCERFKIRKNAKNEHIRTVKEEKLRLARKIPVDVLGIEWMDRNEVTVETRAYLLDKLLPTLILGVEKLLTEVEKKGLAESTEKNPNFNPINYLAQYLMRNNPRYSNFPEASPYIRGLKDVTDELKEHVFSFEDNRLARAKAEARRRREEQQRLIQQKEIEQRVRSARIKDNLKEWLKNSNGKLDIRLLQSSLHSFMENLQQVFCDNEASTFTVDIKPVENPDKKVTPEEFCEFVKNHSNNMPGEIFSKFMTHMTRCAIAFCKSNEKESQRTLLADLFKRCDHTSLGILDRHRVLALLEAFWDNAAWPVKRVLRNPRRWPVIEIDEMDDDVESVATEASVPRLPSDVTELIPNGTSGEKEIISDPASGAKEIISDPASGAKEIISDPASGVKEIISDPASGAKETISDPASGTIETISDPASGAKETISDPASGTIETISDPASGAKDTISDPASGAKETISDPASGAIETISDPASGAKETISDPASGPKEVISDPASGVKEVIADPTSSTKEDAIGDKPQVTEPSGMSTKEMAETEKNDEELTPADSNPDDSEEPKTEDLKEASVVEKDSDKEKVEQSDEETNPKMEEEKTNENEMKQETSQQPIYKNEEGVLPADGISDKKEEATDQSKLDREPHPATATSIGQTSVSFRDDVASPKTNQSYPRSNGRSGSVTTSAFDEHTLNMSQFAQLIQVFLGDDIPDGVIEELIEFINDGYVETEEEKIKRMQQARKAVQTAKRRNMMNQLFDRWDNDGSGYLDLDELLTVLSKFKENMESKVVKKALKTLNKEDGDLRLNKAEFQVYIKAICDHLPGGDDNFDPLIEFLMTSVERSYEERIRGQARKKWLAQIVQSAQTSGASLDPVFKAVFNALYKDAEQHGRGKRISANIALLEHNDMAPHRGATVLRYVAATPDDAHFMLGKLLYRDMKGISFSSVDTGKPLHVPRVQNHGNIMFFNNERAEEDRQGSFIVIPLKDQMRRVFGTLGIDTLNDPQEKSIFITHEISFFQGVSKAFSTAYHYIDIRRKTLRIAESAISWIHRRSPHVMQVDVFIVEPDEKEFSKNQRYISTKTRKQMMFFMGNAPSQKKLEDFVLRKMLTTDRHGNTTTHENPQKLERKENLFRDYLFKCIDNSETIAADAYGVRHTAFPLRDPDGRAVAIVDISIGDLKELPNHENKEVQRMLKLLQTAHKEVSQESAGGDKTIVLEAEKDSEQNRIDIMFDRIMLMDLRENVGKLNARAFAELKSYKEPPKVIHDIVVSVLTLFFQEKSESGELEQWNNCKQLISSDLINKIGEFDPTASEAVNSVQKIAGRLKDVPHGAVAKHGSLPAQHLYNWAFVCLSLLEHSKKMNDKRPGVTQATAPTPQSDALPEST